MKPRPEIAGTRQINVMFERNLIALTSRLCRQQGQIETVLQEVDETLKSLFDYLAFEINKTRLELKALEDLAGPDSEAAVEARTWLKVLESFEADYPTDNAGASVAYLQGLLERLWTVFDDDDADRKQEAALLDGPETVLQE